MMQFMDTIRAVGLCMGLVCVALLDSTDMAQKPGSSERTPPLQPPWSTSTAEQLRMSLGESYHLGNALRQLSRRRGVLIAWECLRERAGCESPRQLDGKDILRLAGDRDFWLLLLYLIEADSKPDALDWVAAVWRAMISLPEDCRFEDALLDAGGGDLLRRLFAESGALRKAKLQWIIAPLPREDLTIEELEGFWDYFTSHGGDVTINDPLAELDLWAATIDLNPSYRATWRKEKLFVDLKVAFDKLPADARWSLALDAVNLRRTNRGRFVKIRQELFDGKREVSSALFRQP